MRLFFFQKTLLLFFLLSYFNPIKSQQLVYDIILLGKKIGTTNIKRTVEKNRETIHVSSFSEAKVMFVQKTNRMEQTVVYENGVLVSSHTKNTVDGVEHITVITKTSSGYICEKKNEKILISEPITNSSTYMYFHEPKKNGKVFSERIGSFCELSIIKPQFCTYTVTDGGTHLITYANGVPSTIEIKKALGSVYMKLNQNGI